MAKTIVAQRQIQDYSATIGAEQIPALTAGNWTVGAGWESPIVGPGLIKNADGTGTQVPSAATTIVAGTTYKVVITLSAWSAGQASFSIGATNGKLLLTSATTYTDYVTALTTDKFTITPSQLSRFTISGISVIPLTDAIGDLTVDGNINGRSEANFGLINAGRINSGNGITAGRSTRALNLIGTDGVMRIWRTVDDAASAASIELIYGVAALPGDAGNVWWDAFANPYAPIGDVGSYIIRDRTGGTGSVRLLINPSGNFGFQVGAPTAKIHIAAGSASANTAPLKLTSGTNLTTAEAGVIEFDGGNLFFTPETTAGRGFIPDYQRFRLTANGSNISTIANFFGANSNPTLVSGGEYLIEIDLYYTVNTAGTINFTFINSAAPTSQNIHGKMSPVNGIQAPQGFTDYAEFDIVNDATATKAIGTGSTLTNGTTQYAHFSIHLFNSTGTSLKIQATKSAGTITPLKGSYWTCVRVPSNNTGIFAA